MSAAAASGLGRRTGLAWFLRAWFVVPASQVHVLDLGYQMYCFEVFHQSWVNRLSHAVGIPISLMATYVLLSRLMWGPEIALAFVVGLHLAICLRARLHGLVPAMLAAHGALWLVAMHGLERILIFDGPLLLHPAFHVLAWPAFQYATHALEATVPPPLSGAADWRPVREVFTSVSVSYVLFTVALAPLHIFVEVVSSYRNLLVLFVLAAWKVGYRPAPLARLQAYIDNERRRPQPVIEIGAFHAARGTDPAA